MIENITEEQLQKIIDEFSLPYSNIGVHKMTGSDNYEKLKSVYDDILQNGFISGGGEKAYHGIISHICMCGLSNNDYVSNIVFDWEYGSTVKDGIKIIFAIPSIIETDNNKYYLGEYPSKRVVKNPDSESIFYGRRVDTIPSEFILGHLKIKYLPGDEQVYWNANYDFIPNSNYIGFKSREEQDVFFKKYETVLKGLNILTFDEDGYKHADFFRKLDIVSPYYFDKFFEKYKELSSSRNK